MMSNISSDMNKPCWKLVKACPQSQILFCSRENNLPTEEQVDCHTEGPSNQKEGLMTTSIKDSILQGQALPSTMDYQKCTKMESP